MSAKVLKYRMVPASLAIWSFREGLCNETSSRSRRKPKENAQTNVPDPDQGRFLYAPALMFLFDSMQRQTLALLSLKGATE